MDPVGHYDHPVRRKFHEGRQFLALYRQRGCVPFRRKRKGHKMNKDTVNQILNRDYIMENVYIRMLHQSQHHSAKYPILNLDAELRIHVRISDSVIGTLQVNDLLCNIANISSDDLWKAAIHNFLKDVCIQSITDFLGFSLPNNEYNLYVVRTPKFMNGAAALCIPEVFQNFCKHHHEQSCFIRKILLSYHTQLRYILIWII